MTLLNSEKNEKILCMGRNIFGRIGSSSQSYKKNFFAYEDFSVFCCNLGHFIIN